MKVASSWMIANIAFDDALILPHRANPAGLNFRERQVDSQEKMGHCGGSSFCRFLRNGIGRLLTFPAPVHRQERTHCGLSQMGLGRAKTLWADCRF